LLRKTQRKYSISIVLTLFAAGTVLGSSRGQARAQKNPILWKETLTSAAKGSHIPMPPSVLDIVRAKPNDCIDPRQEERVKVDSYQLKEQDVTLIPVWGRSSCFCSPTGNCAFWIFRSRGDKYELILRTHLVREFGFLPSHSNGLPDLVLWSHDSAMTLPGNLWQFDGRKYVRKCGWEVVTSYKDLPNLAVEPIESRVENSTCGREVLPDHEPAKNN
jgi:hypothetical protein